MTGKAPSTTVQPDPARPPAEAAHPFRQHRHDGRARRGPRAPTRTGDAPARDDCGPVVIDLVTRARHGDKQAWDALVERYTSLIWSICG
jgi:hypothetical protein